MRGGRLKTHLQQQTTLGQLLAKYRDAVTPGKKGSAQEHQRIEALLRQPIASFSL